MNGDNQSVFAAIGSALTDVWRKFIEYIPEIVAALVVFMVGWLVAAAFGKLVKKLLRFSRIDEFFAKSGLAERFNVRGFTFSGFAGAFVKWFLILVVLVAAADILNLPQITDFLNRVLLYLPHVFVAGVILGIGVIAAQFVFRISDEILGRSNIGGSSAKNIALIGKYGVIVFAGLAALDQLGVVPELIRILFAGIVLTLVLAFGLGGREKAAEWLKKMGENRRAE